MNRVFIIFLLGITLGCNLNQVETDKKNLSSVSSEPSIKDKIKVLNFATFHMGDSSDQSTIEFEKENKKNQQDAKKIAQMISVFKPTVTCVEVPVNDSIELNEELVNSLDSITNNRFKSNPFESIPELNIFEEGLTLLEKLKRMNHPLFLDFLITANSDILTYVGTENGFEGVDEAAKYYHRNLRIYSNLNRLPLNKGDRVFILSGGSHTAFFK